MAHWIEIDIFRTAFRAIPQCLVRNIETFGNQYTFQYFVGRGSGEIFTQPDIPWPSDTRQVLLGGKKALHD
ncbi:Uncharacterised protein [Mycobacteroides abscessus subsp. abscessus]|nr:Uncharacterised protein [Mycobacteroides abscessus subsp. abscessus]